MSKKTIAILGGGNGAHTMAADLAMRGYRVRMYEDAAFIGRLNVLQQTLTIRCRGLINGSGKIEMLTDDMAKAIDGVKFIAVVTPSNAHVAVAQKLKGLVKKEQHRYLFFGILCGIATVPVGCFVAGLMCGLDILTLLLTLLPLLISAASWHPWKAVLPVKMQLKRMQPFLPMSTLMFLHREMRFHARMPAQ